MRRVRMPCCPGTRKQRQRGGFLDFRSRRALEHFRQRLGQLSHAESIGYRLRQLLGDVAQLRHHALAHGDHSALW